MDLRLALANLHPGKQIPRVAIEQAAADMGLLTDPVLRASYYIRSPACPEAIRLSGGAFLDYLRRVEHWTDPTIRANAKRIVTELGRDSFPRETLIEVRRGVPHAIDEEIF